MEYDFDQFKKITISDDKLVNYLLSETHPIGRFKAYFFKNLGFHLKNKELLKQKLIQTITSGTVIEVRSSQFGEKIVIQDKLETSSENFAIIKTVWITEDHKTLRFVTAYPA